MAMRRSACLRTRGAFTIAEAVISMIIVSVMLTAALRVAVYSVTAQARAADRQTGRLLVQSLVDEAMAKPYEDPDGSPVFGLETEAAAVRSGYDDFDDYNGLVESPPKNADGTAIAGLTGWTRTAVVEWVRLSDPMQTTGSESGAKRITVTATHNGAKVASLVAVRTRAP